MFDAQRVMEYHTAAARRWFTTRLTIMSWGGNFRLRLILIASRFSHSAPDRPQPTPATSTKSRKTFSDPAAASYGPESRRAGALLGRTPSATHQVG